MVCMCIHPMIVVGVKYIFIFNRIGDKQADVSPDGSNYYSPWTPSTQEAAQVRWGNGEGLRGSVGLK